MIKSQGLLSQRNERNWGTSCEEEGGEVSRVVEGKVGLATETGRREREGERESLQAELISGGQCKSVCEGKSGETCAVYVCVCGNQVSMTSMVSDASGAAGFMGSCRWLTAG